MAPLSASQLYVLSRYAGWDREQAKVAAALGMAESKGDPTAVNRNRNGSIDRGLWQVNSIHGARFPGNLHDPHYNAQAAYAIWGDRKSFVPWAQFNNGAYKQHLGAAEQAAAVAPPESDRGFWDGVKQGFLDPFGQGTPGDAVLDAGVGAIDAALELPRKVVELLKIVLNPDFWKRIGVGLAGFALILFAGVWVFRDLAGPVASVVPGPVGAAGKALS